ncbi:MAG: HAD-IA family hydrolase [Candidatus Delongbacteria bacterium]|nr:HAD-IA family hydrolase [Candidatus Delongbacteria bacterium]MBN2835930.1 HAD-IA family hydrolase [Candidatus Delongbacteria bacterium]
MSLKLVIFDFDGTIIDTETAWFKAFSDLYQNYNCKLNIKDWLKCVGTDEKHFNPYDELNKLLDKKIDNDIMKSYVNQRFEYYFNKLELREGILELLKFLQNSRIKIAIASSSSINWVGKILDERNLTNFFSYVATSEDVTNVKPSPELYNNVLEHYRCLPSECLVIEDSLNGALASLSTNIRTFVILNEVTKHSSFPNNLSKFNSIKDIDFSSIIDLYYK